jgi:chlorophyll synthase
VQLGAAPAARLACIVMAVPQMIVAGLLYSWGASYYATAIVFVLLAQAGLMPKLLAAPREMAPWYNATGVTLYVTGMMIAAIAVRSITGGTP